MKDLLREDFLPGSMEPVPLVLLARLSSLRRYTFTEGRKQTFHGVWHTHGD